MSLVNTETGEIVAVGPEERTAVARLTTAIAALTEAVDFMPISDVISIKAQVATIQTATKELHMSQEAQELAAEAVRRSEWALGMAIRRGQAEGAVASRENNLKTGASPNASGGNSGLLSPTDLVKSNRERDDVYAMGALEPAAFDEVLDEAKAEGNLSRANVAAKAREKSGRSMRATPRPVAEKSMNLIALYASKAARAANDLTPEQIRRIRPEAGAWTADLRNSIEALQRLVDSLDN